MRILEYFSLIYLSVFILMYSSCNNSTMYVALVLFCIWIILASATSTKSIVRSFLSVPLVCMYVYSFVVFVAGVIGGQMFYTLKNIISIILQFSPVILYIFYQTYNQYILNKLAKKFLCIWLLISLYTIYVYFYIGDIGMIITALQYSGIEFVFPQNRILKTSQEV